MLQLSAMRCFRWSQEILYNNEILHHSDLILCVYICVFVRPDTLPVQGKGLMVQRAEKCPYCDSYFLKNSSDFQQHIWAHQGVIQHKQTRTTVNGKIGQKLGDMLFLMSNETLHN